MTLRALKTSVFLLPFLAGASLAMPQPGDAASTFIRLANLLPCQTDIAQAAQDLGFRETGQTRMDTDYIDIVYSDASDQSQLTVALETTPIGSLFSILLDIPQTDQAYADTLLTALRQDWSLPDTAQLKNLNGGAARNWTIRLAKGDAQITVRHDATTTRLIGILSPQTPGTSLPCK